MKRYIIMLLIFAGLANVGIAQKKNAKSEEPDTAVIKLLESKMFEIRANTALPNYGRSVSLDGRYSIEVKNDSAFVYLPYFGRAYRLPYGGGEGLIFNSVITDYKTEQVKKGATEIKFKTQTKEDSYDFILTVFPGGSASIRVSSNNKQSIDFMGELIMTKEEKKSAD